MKAFPCRPLFVPPTEAQRHLPEGPRLLRNHGLAGDALLGWVAIQHSPDAHAGSMEVLNLRTLENDSHPLPARPGFFAETTTPGVLAVGLERELALYDLRARRLTGRRIPVTDDARVIINDGMAIPGGLLFGTKHLDFKEHIARVYHFDAATGGVREMPERQICSNGKFLFDEDGRLLLVDICSFRKRVEIYEVDFTAGRMDPVRVIADFASTPLYPDGLRPSPDGRSVIVAFYNPEPAEEGLARQFRISDGALEAEWRLPGSPRVTCPEIVSLDGAVRAIFTTAVEGMPATMREHAPMAGALFIGDTLFDRVPAPPPLLDPAAFGDIT
ncbi:MAG: SMP-30/gluconolactonase/LRE family protein [Bryobacteraceae bacterium]